ncbi:hypothetical protein [Olleya sp. R77988]|uniref:hypothetical protein n=1 Tax=Olleya sp. R77988 TaxID=3093875 RepID=UPI0037C6C962
MDNNLNTLKQFYQNLGKLFYAITMSDGVIEPLEIETLKEIITKNWNNDATFILESFNWLNEDNEYNAERCFNSFLDYKIHNSNLFTDDIKQKTTATAIAIASSFSKTNKSELMMLAKLDIEFKKD